MYTDIWFFIDEEGNECVTNTKPLRVKEHLSDYTHRVNYWLENNRYLRETYGCEWYTDARTYLDCYSGIDGYFFELDCVYLPKGTIKKIIGFTLLPENSPIKYNGVKILTDNEDGKKDK